MLKNLIQIINNVDTKKEEKMIPTILEKICTGLENINYNYSKARNEIEKEKNFTIMKNYIIIIYILIYNLKQPDKLMIFLKSNENSLINILKKLIRLYKDNDATNLLPKFIISICFDDLKKKFYLSNDEKLIEFYEKYVYNEFLCLFPCDNIIASFSKEEYDKFMKKILDFQLNEYIENFKKETSDIFCKNIIPLLLTNEKFDFISFYTQLANKHISIISKEYNDDLKSLFRKDDLTNDMIKHVIFMFANDAFIKSFFLTVPNEFLSKDEIEFNMELFDKFFKSFIDKLIKCLPYIVKVLLKIIYVCAKEINKEGNKDDNYNVIYTVLIFNYFISPFVLDVYGISLVKYKSLRQLSRILRNIFFGKEFEKSDKLQYFNRKIVPYNFHVNSTFKEEILDNISILGSKRKINSDILKIMVKCKAEEANKYKDSIIIPSFCIQFFWSNINSAIKSLDNNENNNKYKKIIIFYINN